MFMILLTKPVIIHILHDIMPVELFYFFWDVRLIFIFPKHILVDCTIYPFFLVYMRNKRNIEVLDLNAYAGAQGGF